ncbi:MAG TPA: LysM peptidoglycan-binding domain-containing protein [Candidatus Gallacutalibacter stercoravium]|nr:LysM peptidoglycan-binding domain-containing protein [Candidatus Gallacutalibacter stercoravium]
MPTIMYTVRPGDTLWNIAKRYNTTVNDIARYNGIANPDELEVGQMLRIFVPEEPSMPEVPEWYVTREGDSLYSIAKRFGTTVDELVALNNIRNPDLILPRRALRIRP